MGMLRAGHLIMSLACAITAPRRGGWRVGHPQHPPPGWVSPFGSKQHSVRSIFLSSCYFALTKKISLLVSLQKGQLPIWASPSGAPMRKVCQEIKLLPDQEWQEKNPFSTNSLLCTGLYQPVSLFNPHPPIVTDLSLSIITSRDFEPSFLTRLSEHSLSGLTALPENGLG